MTKHTEKPLPAGRRRRRWLFIVLAVLLLVGGIPVAVISYIRWDADRNLQKVIAELDSSDPRWRLEEVEADRKKVADAENGALVALEVKKQLPFGWDKSFTDFGSAESLELLPPNMQLSDEQKALLREALGKVEKAVQQARQLKDYRWGRLAITYTPDWFGTLLADAQRIREVGWLLQNDVRLSADEEKIDDAWQSSLAILMTSRAPGDEPVLITQLIRLALRMIALSSMERTLGQGIVSEANLLDAQRRLEEELQENLAVYGLRGERAGSHMFFSNVQNGKVNISELVPASSMVEQSVRIGAGGSVLGLPWTQRSHAWVLERLTRALEIAELPAPQRIKQWKELKDEMTNELLSDISLGLADLFAPSWIKVAESTVRVDANLHCAICAIACERYRIKHQRWPESLEELVQAKLISAVPVDPYDGQPLRYRQTKNGIIVYSIGQDSKNNGDSLDNPWLESPRPRVEFREWNPSMRRQPHQSPPEADILPPAFGEEQPANFRKPKDDADLQFWLQNMVWYHRFSNEEIQAATGLAPAEIEAALKRFNISPQTKPKRENDSVLLVLPYPGGRHPRIGFREGAIRPQREAKFSVFTPWDESSYVVVDMPEAIWSNLGLTYLAHTHIPTIWEQKNIEMEKLEWQRLDGGKLKITRQLPNGITFAANVVPTKDAVRMHMALSNGTDQQLSNLRVQMCVMLAGASGFEQQNNDNKRFIGPYAAAHDKSRKRWVITAWDPSHRTWANEKCPCIHSDPKFPDCAPGETKHLYGWLSFYEGDDIEAEIHRINGLPWKTELDATKGS